MADRGTLTEFIGWRCDPPTRAALETLAGKEQVSMSETLRRMVVDMAAQCGLWPVAADGDQERVTDESG